jgi:hypothetical protein
MDKHMKPQIWLLSLIFVPAATVLFGPVFEGAVSAQDRLTPEQTKAFESKIRPVLVEHCYECHSVTSEEPGGGLLLDSAAGTRKGGVSGPAVVPGKPQSSLLLLAMQHSDSNLKMPPADYGDKLPENVIADFEKWIRAGAPDPRPEVKRSAKAEANNAASQSWWAWQAISKPTLPQVEDKTWPSSELDYFVLAGLEQAGLTPSPKADRITLVRRLAFDLTGLPPSLDELERYALSDTPKSIEELVDHYLASESYGERMGRHWLDVARYAESTGKDVNAAYPLAWRYRDYVIDAMATDMPFDQFMIEQIAGDLLRHKGADEQGRHTIATGFLALGTKGLNERNPNQFAADLADEQIDAVSQAFMATTMACARCHDHKFDPISQRDYTALAGIFLSTETHFGTLGGVGGVNRGTLADLPSIYASTTTVKSRSADEVARMQDRIEEIQVELREAQLERFRGKEVNNGELLRLRQQQVRLQTELDSLDSDGKAKAKAMGVADKPAPSNTPFDRARRTRMANSSSSAGNGANRFISKFDSILDSPLLIRGEIDKPSEVVARGLPEFLAKNFPAKIGREESGRMQLARWLASEKNPLTARVIVNRVWSWYIGEGIVRTVDNFGTSGELPSNQALLDFLAVEFVKNNWSIKTLVKKIVLSSTYQQASDVREDAFLIDPDNRLAWRAMRKALDAEELRDSLLVASGKLQTSRPQGSIVSDAGDGLIGFRRGNGLSETAVVEANPPYRSVYLPVPRNVLPESLELFDFADNSVVSGARDLTIVPAQALYWMNSESVEEQCRAIARKLVATLRAEAGPRPTRMSPSQGRELADKLLEQLTLQLLARPPLDAERTATRKYLQEQRRNGDDFETMWTGIARALVSSADYRFLR